MLLLTGQKTRYRKKHGPPAPRRCAELGVIVIELHGIVRTPPSPSVTAPLSGEPWSRRPSIRSADSKTSAASLYGGRQSSPEPAAAKGCRHCRPGGSTACRLSLPPLKGKSPAARAVGFQNEDPEGSNLWPSGSCQDARQQVGAGSACRQQGEPGPARSEKPPLERSLPTYFSAKALSASIMLSTLLRLMRNRLTPLRRTA